MPSADFAAAQQRIAARRAQRAAYHTGQHDTATTRHPSSRAPSFLPFPLGGLSTTGRSVWNAVKGRSGTRPEFRVGQVDAELLDEELLTLLKAQVGDGFKYFGTHVADSYAAEISLALRLILFKLSIWDHNASYGAHLQGLRYTDARSTAPNRPPPKPWQKMAYGILTVGGRYSWTKWQEYMLATSEDYTRPESPQLQLLASLSEWVNLAHDMASLGSFLVFLINGRYRTLVDRLLRLRLTPTSHSTSREVSFEYLNRQLVWHAFTEFLLFLLPLVGISRWRRVFSRSWRKFRSSLSSLRGRSATLADDHQDQQAGELGFLPERTCAICYRDTNPTTVRETDILVISASGSGGIIGSAATDITNPYETIPCGCIYCFACIAQRIANEEGEGWTCLLCGEIVKECKPWTGDILDPTFPSKSQSHIHDDERPNTAKSVGFATIPASVDEEVSLRELDPMPELEVDNHSGDRHGIKERQGSLHTTLNEGRVLTENNSGFNLGDSFTESSEWARASEASESEEADQRSEDYDEDDEEEEEGEGQALGAFDYDR